MAGATRLELATSGVTGRRSNQTELRPRIICISKAGRRNRAWTCDPRLVRPVLSQLSYPPLVSKTPFGIPPKESAIATSSPFWCQAKFTAFSGDFRQGPIPPNTLLNYAFFIAPGCGAFGWIISGKNYVAICLARPYHVIWFPYFLNFLQYV